MKLTFRYELESKANKKGESLIYLIMSYGFKEFDPKSKKQKYQSLKISTQWSIRKEDWDGFAPTKKYTASKGNTLKNALNRLMAECENHLHKYYDQHHERPHPNELKAIIEEKTGRTETKSDDIRIVDHIDAIIQANSKLPTTAKERIGKKQIQKYKTVSNMIQAFEESHNMTMTLSNLTAEMYFNLWNFTNENFKKRSDNEYGYLASTMAKNATTLRSLLKKGEIASGLLGLNPSSKRLLLKDVEARDAEVYLSEQHLKTIIDADTLKSKEFENAKNYLIICSFTSLRYSDMAKLHEVKTEQFEVNGVEFEGFITQIRKGSKVTEKVEVCVPALKPVADILKMNAGRFPTFPTNQKMNEQIKKFAKHIGLDEPRVIEHWYYDRDEPVVESIPLHSLMKCHIGRGTFISNLINLGFDESDFDHITHPERKNSTIKKHYDKRVSTEKAARLVQTLKELRTESLYKL
jgi:predicted RNase H-like HicB family nuclease